MRKGMLHMCVWVCVCVGVCGCVWVWVCVFVCSDTKVYLFLLCFIL